MNDYTKKRKRPSPFDYVSMEERIRKQIKKAKIKPFIEVPKNFNKDYEPGGMYRTHTGLYRTGW